MLLTGLDRWVNATALAVVCTRVRVWRVCVWGGRRWRRIQVLGPHRDGVQRIIPILGGTFQGPNIRGEVLPGGADWNLARNDGVTVVEAAYFMRTHDNITFKIVNTGVNPAVATPGRPRFTHPVFDAPAGAYDWLNKGMFVGTLTPGKGQVTIGVYQLA